MASSKIEICNLALGYLGEPPIADLDEKRPAAIYCKLYLGPAIAAVLREHPWNFAQAREKLAPVTKPEGWYNYSQAYALPNKCVNIHFLLSPGGFKSRNFEMADTDNRTILLTSIPQAVADFTRLIDDASRFDPYFVQVLARKLQAFIVKPLCKNNPPLVQEAETLYQRELEAARLQDAREGRRFQDASPGWDGGHDVWADVLRRECGV